MRTMTIMPQVGQICQIKQGSPCSKELERRITRDIPTDKYQRFSPAFFAPKSFYGIITEIDKNHEVCYIRSMNDPQESLCVNLEHINIEENNGSDEIYQKRKNGKNKENDYKEAKS